MLKNNRISLRSYAFLYTLLLLLGGSKGHATAESSFRDLQLTDKQKKELISQVNFQVSIGFLEGYRTDLLEGSVEARLEELHKKLTDASSREEVISIRWQIIEVLSEKEQEHQLQLHHEAQKILESIDGLSAQKLGAADLLLAKAKALAVLGQHEQALEFYHKAFLFNPQKMKVYIDVLGLFLTLKPHELKTEYWQYVSRQWLDAGEAFFEIQKQKGENALNADFYSKAYRFENVHARLSVYRANVIKNPEATNILLNTDYYASVGIDHLEQACKLAPDNTAFYYKFLSKQLLIHYIQLSNSDMIQYALDELRQLIGSTEDDEKSSPWKVLSKEESMLQLAEVIDEILEATPEKHKYNRDYYSLIKFRDFFVRPDADKLVRVSLDLVDQFPEEVKYLNDYFLALLMQFSLENKETNFVDKADKHKQFIALSGDELFRAYQKNYQLNPTATCAIMIANLFYKRDRISDGLTLTREFVDAHPEDYRLQGALGCFLMKAGEYQKAVEHFQRAACKASGDRQSKAYDWKNLALARLLAGQVNDAAHAYTIARGLYKNDSGETEDFYEGLDSILGNPFNSENLPEFPWNNLEEVLRDHSEDQAFSSKVFYTELQLDPSRKTEIHKSMFLLKSVHNEILRYLKMQEAQTVEEKVECLNSFLNHGLGLGYVASLEQGNDSFPGYTLAQGKGNCLSLSLLYLILAEHLQLPLEMEAIPRHAFISHDSQRKQRVIEATEFSFLERDHDSYKRLFSEETSYKQFLQNQENRHVISKQQALAYMVSNFTAELHYRNKSEQALKKLDLLHKVFPKEKHFLKGKVLVNLCKWKQAEPGDGNGSSALDTFSIDQNASNLIQVLREDVDSDKVLSLLDKIIQLDPADSFAYSCKRQVYTTYKKDDTEAVENAILATKLAWNASLTELIELAESLEKQEKIDLALKCYQSAVEINPDSIQAQSAWAAALSKYQREDQASKARVALQHVIEALPVDKRSLISLLGYIEDDSEMKEHERFLLALYTPRQIGEFFKDGEILPRDCDRAMKYYQKAIMEGDSVAAHDLGEWYFAGFCDKKPNRNDLQQAHSYYEKGSQLGNKSSTSMLATFYDPSNARWAKKRNKIVGGADANKAAQLYLEAANKREVLACDRLARLYLNGLHPGGKNLRKAYDWFKKASQLGSETSTTMLASFYDSSDAEGTQERNNVVGGADPEKAAELYLQAGLQGHARAFFRLGNIYLEGRHPQGKNLAQAFGYYMRGGKLDDKECITMVASYFDPSDVDWAKERNQVVGGADAKRAASLYLTAAKRGQAWACYRLGNLFLEGTHYNGKHLESALKLYRRGTELKHKDCMAKLASFYDPSDADWARERNKAVGGADAEKAIELYLQAAEQGNTWAQNRLGSIYYNGAGTERNESEALTWYRKAAEQEAYTKDSLNNLAWIYATSSEVNFLNGTEAQKLALKAVEKEKNHSTLDTLAAAYARNGEFEKAIATVRESIDLLNQEDTLDHAAKQNQLLDVQGRLDLYLASMPYTAQKD